MAKTEVKKHWVSVQATPEFNNAEIGEIPYTEVKTLHGRVMRTRRDKVDDAFICTTKDKVKIRVKPFFITKNKTNKLILSKLRLSVRGHFEEYTKQTEFNKIIKDLTSNFIQREFKQELKKIYPLNLFEIRELTREK